MAAFNKVILMGNLTREPELRYTIGGTAVCNLCLAVNRVYRTQDGEQKDETCFVDVTVWNKSAEACNSYLHKGNPLFVEGHLQQDEWIDTTTGQKRMKLSICAESVKFIHPIKKSGR